MSSTKYNNKYLDDIAIDLASIKFNQESKGEGYLATPRSSSSASTIAEDNGRGGKGVDIPDGFEWDDNRGRWWWSEDSGRTNYYLP